MKELVVRHLVKRYQQKIAVNDLSLKIKGGQFVAFLGPNGAGKSTTINMLTGMLQPTSGEITIDELPPTSQKYRQKLGVVFQNSVLDDDLSVQANLKIRAGMYHHVASGWLDELITAFQLQEVLKQKYGSLSGGQRRRVDIARALINKPEVLFLDEPSTGLDIQTRQLIWHVLDALRVQNAMTVLLTTHYLEEAQTADMVYVIDHGELLVADTVTNLEKGILGGRLTLFTKETATLKQSLSNKTIEVTNDGVVVQNIESHEVMALLNANQAIIDDFEYQRVNLNDIFIQLTGEGVRK